MLKKGKTIEYGGDYFICTLSENKRIQVSVQVYSLINLHMNIAKVHYS